MRAIKSDPEYRTSIESFKALSARIEEDTERLEVLAILIHAYEAESIQLLPLDPIEAIKFRMDQQGLKQVDLVPYIGNASKVSEVLSGKIRLSLNMIRRLHKGLKIPYSSLMGDQ